MKRNTVVHIFLPAYRCTVERRGWVEPFTTLFHATDGADVFNHTWILR